MRVRRRRIRTENKQIQGGDCWLILDHLPGNDDSSDDANEDHGDDADEEEEDHYRQEATTNYDPQCWRLCKTNGKAKIFA